MPDALTIRPAAPNDAQEVARIRVLGWRFAYQGLVPQGYLDSLNVAEDTERMHGYLSQLPQNLPPNNIASVQGPNDGEKRSFMLAVRDDAVLGFCHFSAAPNNADRPGRATPGGEMVGRLHSLYIDPDALGQGIYWTRPHEPGAQHLCCMGVRARVSLGFRGKFSRRQLLRAAGLAANG